MVTLTKEQEVIAHIIWAGEEGAKVSALAKGLHRSETTVRRTVKQLIDVGELVNEEGRIKMATRTRTKKEEAPAEEKQPRTGQRAHTTELDNKILAVITKSKDKGVTKDAVAEAVNTTPTLAYGALHRLKAAGKINIQRVEGSRTPVYTAA